MMTQITTQQIKILQSLLGRLFRDKEERLAFLSEFLGRELSSVKELTEGEAFEILEYLKYDFAKYASFDFLSRKHLEILSKCHELGWVQTNNPRFVDLERLGKWLFSKRCPVQKPLLQMTAKEVSKVISALEKVTEKQYASTCPHTHQVTRTIDGACTVQVTAIFCADCGKQLTEPNVET